MGSQVKVLCKCGLKKNLMVGGTWAGYKHTQYFPCCCKECKDVVQGNVKKWRKRCPNCSKRVIPYNKSKLIGKIGNETIAQTFNYIVTNGTYKCARCENMTLYFDYGDLMWD